jgi:hypothetical protein
MSLLGLHSFMYRLKNDQELQQNFKARPSAAFKDFELTEGEMQALQDGDVASLFKMGVHPLLLAPYSRYAAIPRPDYQARLAPLRGTRILQS